MKHTPGPWKLFATPNDIDFTHEISGVAAIYIGNHSEGNAKLMVAAPDLLEALRDMVDYYGTASANVDALFKARKAIAKAEA